MKPVVFLGDSLEVVREFPPDARREAGFQIDKVQRGLSPDHWRPMATIATGVGEIRIRADSGIYRVLYLAKIRDAVYILHAFQKKTRKTTKADLDLARSRWRALVGRQQ